MKYSPRICWALVRTRLCLMLGVKQEPTSPWPTAVSCAESALQGQGGHHQVMRELESRSGQVLAATLVRKCTWQHSMAGRLCACSNSPSLPSPSLSVRLRDNHLWGHVGVGRWGGQQGGKEAGLGVAPWSLSPHVQ